MSEINRPLYVPNAPSGSYYESLISRIDPDLKALWIAKLRSGEYEQGKRVLKTHDGKFCCLGVYCDMMGIPEHEGMAEVEQDDGKFRPIPVIVYGDSATDGSWATIPRGYGPKLETSGPLRFDRDFTGTTGVFGAFSPIARGEKGARWALYTLPALNDNGFTFNQIADIIDYFL